MYLHESIGIRLNHATDSKQLPSRPWATSFTKRIQSSNKVLSLLLQIFGWFSIWLFHVPVRLHVPSSPGIHCSHLLFHCSSVAEGNSSPTKTRSQSSQLGTRAEKGEFAWYNSFQVSFAGLKVIQSLAVGKQLSKLNYNRYWVGSG